MKTRASYLKLLEDAAETAAQRHDLVKGLTEHGGEGEEAESVARWRGVEHNHVVVHGLHLGRLRRHVSCTHPPTHH